MRLVLTSLLLATGCDCYQTRTVDAGQEPLEDAGLDAAFVDAGASEDASVDASMDAGWRCGTREDDTFGLQICEPGESFCCHQFYTKEAPSKCNGWPPEEVEKVIDCRELPRDLPQLEQSCETPGACPSELPWCCTVVDWYAIPMSDRCVPRPLFGWDCFDLEGMPAGDTFHGELTEAQARRCEEDQPCPEEWPYCCGNLFCVDDPERFYGWDCAVSE